MKIEVQIGCEFGYADFFLGKFVFLQSKCVDVACNFGNMVYSISTFAPSLGA